MKKKFKIAYVHMGSDKTGSTTLQSFMDKNRGLHESVYGICYAPEIWHARFASFFSGSDRNFIHNVESELVDEKEIIPLDREYMCSLENYIMEIDKSNVLVFSYEGFHCLTVNGLFKLKNYLLQLADQVKLIYYVRSPCSYAISGMSQYIRSGRAVNDHPPVQPYKNYLSKFQEVFSKDEIVLKKFSRNDLYMNDIVPDFLKILNESYNYSNYLSNKKTENGSLSGLACFVGNRVIKKYFSSDPRKDHSPFELGRRLLPHLLNIKGDKLKLTPVQFNNVLTNSQESTDYIKNEFALDLNEDQIKFIYSAEELSEINSNIFQSKVDSMASRILKFITMAEGNIKEKVHLNIDSVSFNDIKNNQDIDFLRDEAVAFENSDLNKAYKLMQLAYKARPEGPFIKAKFMEYRARLSKG
ncbi:hypothetical protein [Pseudoalteromonas tetraodonis]|uniref:hypothetical protein n=1 Tax=Pseudoalteromonas tetraodonis TaxID=43659 RepID=UPI003A972EB8